MLSRRIFLLLASSVPFAGVQQSVFAATDRDRWIALRAETMRLLTTGHQREAEAKAGEMLHLAEHMSQPPANWTLVSEALNFLAAAYDGQQRPADALAARKRIVQVAEQYGRADGSDLCTALVNIARGEAGMGHVQEAEAAYLRVLKIKEREDPPHVATPLTHLGTFYLSVKRYSEADIVFRRLADIYEQDGGHDNPQLRPVFEFLAQIAAARGRHADAKRYSARAAQRH